MLNFSVGPVQSEDYVREIGANQVPYFRTPEFSEVMFENEKLVLKFAKAPKGSRAVFITGSGTASMEASVINTLTKNDKAIVVNGGSFGHRFAEILDIHKIPHDDIVLETGKALTKERLLPFENKGYTAFLVNVHETSTGVRYDMNLIGEFCKRNGIFLIADAISSFLADELDMEKIGADILMTGSQKALACPPGVSIIVMSPRALKRIENTDSGCMYLDLKRALSNGERGQTPFTPAVGTLLQINARLRRIDETGGVDAEIKRVGELAAYFREKIKAFPFKFVSESPSNAVTSLSPEGSVSAYTIFTVLKDEYGIWICPNGGELKDKIFRVGHIGALTKADYDTLFNALEDMRARKIF